jgi:endo-1,4-beta-xylanase
MNRLFVLPALVMITSVSGITASPAAQFVNSANSGECLHRPRGFTPDGTPTFLFHCHGVPNEQWTLGNGQIIVIGGGMCLDVQGSAPTEGAPVLIVTCNGRPSQKWSIVNGQIVGIGGKCLDTLGGGTSDHTPLIISTCSPAPTQQWSVQ